MVGIVGRECVATLLRTTRDAQLVALLQSGAQHCILPVGALAEGGYLVICIAALVGPIVFLEPCPSGGIEQIKLFTDVAKANIIGIVNVCLSVATLPLLRRDENDTIGTTRTIDGGSTNVFQYLDALDVVRVDGSQRIKAALNATQPRRVCIGILEIDKAVNDVKRLV